MASNSTTSATTGLDHTYIAELEEDLTVQRAYLNSLLDVPETLETREQIRQLKVGIADLQKRLGEARGQSRARNHHFTSSNPSAMSSPGDSRAGTPSNQRKRSFGSSHLSAAVGGRPESKSRKSTPIHWNDDDLFAEDDFFNGAPIIDLTGDDDDAWRSVVKKQEETEERLHRNKAMADSDFRLAQQLSQGKMPAQNSSTFGQSSRHSQPNAFGQMWNRSSQSGNIKAEPSLGIPRSSPSKTAVKAESISGLSAADVRFGQPSSMGARSIKSEDLSYLGSRGVKSERGPSSSSFAATFKPGAGSPDTKYRVPGAFVDSSEDDSSPSAITPYSTGYQLPNPSRPTVPTQVSLPQRPGGVGYAQPPHWPSVQYPVASPIEQARQTALAFQGYQNPSMVYPHYGANQAPAAPFSGYGGALNPSLLDLNRPGYLHNGSYATPGPSSYGSLSSVISQTNGISFDNFTDPYGNQLNPNLVNFLTDYVEDPRKTEEEIQNLLSNIRPDMDIPAEERGETPEALRYPLYIHQQLSLKWMTDMEKGSNHGGILADDMGLGKTISTLALMVTRQSDDTIKTNLIIGPVALIKQWEMEIKKKLKSTHKLSVFLLHQKKKVSYHEIKRHDVVLTTYGSIASEWKQYQLHIEQRKQSAGYDPSEDLALQIKCPVLHPRSKFYRVILDEAQCIKNKDTQQSKAAHQIEAVYRWCLTGTPMMNGVSELFPLIRFLRIKPYAHQKQFTEAFKSLYPKARATDPQKTEAMKRLQAVLKAMMLRRMKNSVIDGKPILTLPPKTQLENFVVFSEDELKFYKDLEGRTQVQFNKYLRQGTVGKNYSNILVLLLRLRQACCHPHLMDFECVGSNEVSETQMVALAKTLELPVIERLKGIEAFECPICYDAVADPTLIIPCGHDTCSECFASLTDQAAQGNIRSGNENAAAAKCPVCRGPVDPLKVINYTAFQRAHMPAKAPVLMDGSETESGTDSGSETEDGDTDSSGSLKDFIVSDEDEGVKLDDDAAIEAELAAAAKAKKIKKEKKLAMKMTKTAKVKAGKKATKKLDGEIKPHQLGKLRHEAGKNQEARRRYMHYLRDNWEDSAKVNQVIELLTEIQETNEKTIIFSQWTSLLDLIECQIKYRLGLRYCRYTGGMSRNHRDEAVTDFVQNPRNTVMLVSLRAGNAGLNLTVASRVIICDPFWNPYIEMQAVDRAHRIGQQREVKVHRILVKETVEDRILHIQEDKRKLVEAALDEGEAKNLGRLSVNELRYLFGVQSRPGR